MKMQVCITAMSHKTQPALVCHHCAGLWLLKVLLDAPGITSFLSFPTHHRDLTLNILEQAVPFFQGPCSFQAQVATDSISVSVH